MTYPSESKVLRLKKKCVGLAICRNAGRRWRVGKEIPHWFFLRRNCQKIVQVKRATCEGDHLPTMTRGPKVMEM